MTRIAVTSDLHYDLSGALTPPEEVARVIDEMSASAPDAILVAGDIGHPLANFRGCLDLLRGRSADVGIVAGNHDVWREESLDSERLWQHELPAATRQRGLRWLEQDTLRLGSLAVVGTVAWYDYSAAEPSLGKDEAFFAAVKPQLSNDAYWIDWPASDVEVAAVLRAGLATRLDALQRDPAVADILVVTHVPVLEQQLRRNPADYGWSVANAYFGNLRTGWEILRYPKVRTVVSGHTHFPLHATVPREDMPSIDAWVVGGDYGTPAWILLEL
jgi:3',5'-cyclic AMP phosphodiesterase CpdA